MKKIVLSCIPVLAFALLLTGCGKKENTQMTNEPTPQVGADVMVEGEPMVYQINTSTSMVKWNGKKITGAGHEGTVNIKSGHVVVTGNKITDGELVIDMNSITNTDSDTPNDMLITHLKSDDFFGVEQFPEARFDITSTQGSITGAWQDITGDLTIRDKTHVANFGARVEGNTNADGTAVPAKVVGDMIIDRSKYDVKFGSGSFFTDLGDNLIEDQFLLEFELEIAQ